MKAIRFFAFAVCVTLVVLSFGCQKEYPSLDLTHRDTLIIHDTIGVVHDTIRIHDTICPSLTRTQMLTAKKWRVDFTNEIISGVYSQYYLGGANTTGVNYDNITFRFNTDGTGTTTDQYGTPYSMAWHFTASDERSMAVTVNGRTDQWQMVELSGVYLHGASQIILSGNPNNMESFRLIQIP